MNAKKKHKCKKSRKCTFDFKIHVKKGRNAKKRQKMHFNLKIHAKKGKNGKNKAHLFGFVSLLYTLCIFFCILNLKIHIKKTKMQKKSKKKISNCKNTYAKNHKIIFQKNMQKKSINAKKSCKKKAGGV